MKTPPELDRITDVVLAYKPKPKPKTKAALRRKRKAQRDAVCKRSNDEVFLWRSANMAPATKPAKVVRYSCKCKLCKAKWTTELSDYMATYNAHEPKCPGYADYFLKRTKGMVRPMTRDRMAAEQYQMACFCLDRRPIQGRYNAEIKCDGRCMGATGHNCECSCGGANHGKAMAA